ncbi:MAG: DUF1638 domain-containing protein [Methanosarcina sp.]
MQTDIVIIACSIFRYELEYLQSRNRIDIPIVYIGSMLHMNPKKLQELLDARLKEYEHSKVILLFGDCHARMLDYETNTNVVRAQGINCCEIFLGFTEYNRLRKDGAFILLPEWSVRWKEAFIDYMGFENSKSTSLFMNDMHKKIVFVDTGFGEINQPLLTEIAEYFSLPLELHHISLAVLEKSLTLMIDKQRNAACE